MPPRSHGDIPPPSNPDIPPPTPSRPIPGVGVAVVGEGQVLLVRRGRPPAEGQWAVPGGKVDVGETLREAARREVLEETGLHVDVGDVIWAGESIGPGEPPEWHYVLVDFLGRVAAGEAVAGDDADEVGWFGLDQAHSLPLTATMPELLDVLAEAGHLR